jgi:PTH1 family peptidyl-tRNA hydrolase
MRVRLGVGEVPKLMNQSDWVLSRFMSEERDDIDRGILRAADATECILSEGVIKAMNAFNTKLKKPKPEPKPKDDQATPSESQVQESETNSSSQS